MITCKQYMNIPWQICPITVRYVLMDCRIRQNLMCLFCDQYYITYFLTPWCRVLLEKLPGLQLVKKFPAFHGTRRFITALTSFRHLSLSWASPIQSIYPHPTSCRSILILSTHQRLGLPTTNITFFFFGAEDIIRRVRVVTKSAF